MVSESFDLVKLGDSLHGGHVRAVKGGIGFQRMPDAMAAFFERTDMERIRKRTSAGMRLVFRSNTSNIHAHFRFGLHSRKAFVIETIVEGISHITDFSEGDGTGEGILWQSGNSEKKEREFSIWLPIYAETEILEWAFSPGASFEPVAAESPRWLAIGDSITQGMSSTAPSRSWAAQLSQLKKLDLWNFGVGGAIAEPELATFLKEERCDFITIAFGTNDCYSGRAIAEYQQAYRIFFSRLELPKDTKPRILVVGPPPNLNDPVNALGLKLADYQRALKEVCGELAGVQYVNGFSLIPAEQPYFPAGDLHPNDLGMKTFAENLAPYFK